MHLEYNCQWKKDRGRDDRKHSVTPPPARSLQEGLSGQWSSKRRADERGTGEGEGKSSVPKTSCIGDENIQDQIESVISNPIQDISSGVRVRAVAGSKDDNTKDIDGDKDQQSLGTPPNSEYFSDGQLQHTSNDVGKDIRRADLGSGTEVGKDVLDNSAADRRLQSEDEESQPDTAPLAPTSIYNQCSITYRAYVPKAAFLLQTNATASAFCTPGCASSVTPSRELCRSAALLRVSVEGPQAWTSKSFAWWCFSSRK